MLAIEGSAAGCIRSHMQNGWAGPEIRCKTEKRRQSYDSEHVYCSCETLYLPPVKAKTGNEGVKWAVTEPLEAQTPLLNEPQSNSARAIELQERNTSIKWMRMFEDNMVELNIGLVLRTKCVCTQKGYKG